MIDDFGFASLLPCSCLHQLHIVNNTQYKTSTECIIIMDSRRYVLLYSTYIIDNTSTLPHSRQHSLASSSDWKQLNGDMCRNESA